MKASPKAERGTVFRLLSISKVCSICRFKKLWRIAPLCLLLYFSFNTAVLQWNTFQNDQYHHVFSRMFQTSEDCLYLNIYRPSTTQADGLLPVFVFLHGGNFHSGACSALLYDGRFLAQVADAIVVVPNYRVGKLAWMSTKRVMADTGFL